MITRHASLILLALAAAGCVVEEQTTGPAILRPARTAGSAPATAPPAAPGAPGAAAPAPTGAARPANPAAAHVVAEVRPLGAVPYDDMTLPIVSPDARFLATAVGVAPPWEAILAERGAAPGAASRIEVYELAAAIVRAAADPASADPVPPAPRLRTVIGAAAMLGRGADVEGFLVEAPQPDGSRRIGRASWSSGDLAWLVEDSAVNAFAALGPGGRLAWCRRAPGAAHFDLVVRRGEATLVLPAQGGDWLMPVWSGATEDGLFVLLLRDGRLDAVFMIATDEEAMRRTLVRTTLASSGATIETAYQTLVAPGAPVRPALRDQLVLFHPARSAAAVWAPPDPPALLDRASISVAVDPSDAAWAFVTLPRELVRREIGRDSGVRSRMADGLHLVRPTADDVVPFILLQPREGSIGVSAMRTFALP